MSTAPSLRWLLARLPVDPDGPGRSGGQPHPIAQSLVFVMAGGIVGSLSRAWIEFAFPHSPTVWPWSTMIVNVIGSGALGFLLVLLIERFPTARTSRPLLGTGVIGAFTTFSTFAVDAVQLAHAGRVALAGLYIVVTLGATLAAAIAGMLGARAVDRLVDRERWSRRVRHVLDAESHRSEP